MISYVRDMRAWKPFVSMWNGREWRKGEWREGGQGKYKCAMRMPMRTFGRCRCVSGWVWLPRIIGCRFELRSSQGRTPWALNAQAARRQTRENEEGCQRSDVDRSWTGTDRDDRDDAADSAPPRARARPRRPSPRIIPPRARATALPPCAVTAALRPRLPLPHPPPPHRQHRHDEHPPPHAHDAHEGAAHAEHAGERVRGVAARLEGTGADERGEGVVCAVFFFFRGGGGRGGWGCGG
ncbi:hypothetical protein B0H11DRAFT_2009234 [Mycena galericulata]|nr:hypothetical protein B0H11DRAFT_2009234 [Mycena galericulata]